MIHRSLRWGMSVQNENVLDNVLAHDQAVKKKRSFDALGACESKPFQSIRFNTLKWDEEASNSDFPTSKECITCSSKHSRLDTLATQDTCLLCDKLQERFYYEVQYLEGQKLN